MSEERDDLSERVALFRHRLIARLLPQELTPGQRQREIARIVAGEHQIPGTMRTRVAESTLRDWLRDYRASGFEALKPKKRIDAGHPRALLPEVAERLLQIKEQEPDLSIRLITDQIRKEGLIGTEQYLPVSTVHRLFKQHGLMSRANANGMSEDRRRFAYQQAGQLWMSDVMHGPSVIQAGRRKHKTYLIAFLDDATRVIPHAEFAFSENNRAFLPIFKRALIRRGIPERLFVDNGANYRSHQFAVVCAKLGVALIHARPFQPQGKGKIERFFRTCRAQLITRLTDQDTANLAALNRRLAGWIEGEYHHCPHRGLAQQTPLERWAQVSDGLRYPNVEMDLDDLFLFEEQRTVQNDRTVSLHGRLFEVDASLVGQRVTLRYDPSRPDAPVQVVHQGQVIAQARQVDLYANCFVKRQRRGTLHADRQAKPPASSLSMTALDSHPHDDDNPQGGDR
ncbi:MAG: DDE-type integrase/transposase/recombinase [Gammaproteobacteria bacterium]|nr:DDE-type integrase/transposase/recombinase [Gammaproteobacteria bacterium]